MPAPKKRGRPSLPDEKRKRNNVTIRMTDALKTSLEISADDQGRSLSEEIESRLEASIKNVREAEELLGGSYVFGILMIIGRAIQHTGGMINNFKTGASTDSPEWLGDPYAYDQAVKAVDQVLEAFRPDGEIAPPLINDPTKSEVLDEQYIHLTNSAINTALDPVDPKSGTSKHWGKSVNRRLKGDGNG